MAVEAPMCRFCGSRHWGAKHVWGKDDPMVKFKEDHNIEVATKAKFTPKSKKKPKKVAIEKENPVEVATIRRVSIRGLNQGISKHFSDLPFEVTKNGKVIARVTGV